MQLRVAHVIPTTEAEGPGPRFAVWVQGCSLRCPGCCNPELFSAQGGADQPVERLAALAAASGAEGVSVLGGEPFEQAEGLAAFCRTVQASGQSVMVYTGYTLAELKALRAASVDDALSAIDLLVDGRYDAGQPDETRRWIGSRNQALHFLTPRYSPGDPRFHGANTVELRLSNGKLTVNGWPAQADGVRFRRE